MDKVTCTEILIVEFCTSPESEMKEVGSRTEGVEVLTVTEADDGTRSDTIESVREQMLLGCGKDVGSDDVLHLSAARIPRWGPR